MKSVALHNLGCKVNSYEMDVMQQMLQERGYEIVPFDENADIYIVNTCSVTNIADRKSRQMLHRAKKKNPQAVVVAVGCYVQTGKEEVEKDPCIDLAIGNNKKKEMVSILEAYLEELESVNGVENMVTNTKTSAVIDINHTDEYEEMQLQKTAEHTRAYIKIQDGCNQFCSYCIIPYARGRVRSRRKEDIFHEVTTLVEKGYQEIVLTGIHISSYGIDFKEVDSAEAKESQVDYLENGNDSLLLALVKELHKIEGLKRIRLGSLEPRIVTEHFAKEIAGLEKVCPHFHLSLQSGCDETLKRMNRRYSAKEYKETVDRIRAYMSQAAITTDVIVGFPSESDEEFEITKKYVSDIRFSEMHVFKYSKRQGTRAAEMPHQVTDMKKSSRSEELISIGNDMSKEYRNQFLNMEVEVLFEESKEIDNIMYMIGHTKHYVKVALRTDEDLTNQICKVTATGFLSEEILLASK